MRYLLFVALAFGAEPFPNWSDDTTRKMLTDSAWSHGKRVGLDWVKRDPGQVTYKDIPGADHKLPNTGAGPLGGVGVRRTSLPEKADILLRWASALPVRQATALYRVRSEKLGMDKLNELIPAPETNAVFELFGVPAEIAHKGTGVVEAIVRDSAYLYLGSGKKLRPVKVEVKMHALTMDIQIHFVRPKLSDEDVEVYADLQIFQVKDRFKLKPMVYNGQLEM